MMLTNRKYGLLIFILALAFVTLACGLGGSAEPTQAPQPVEPTAAPEEPTEAPTAEPAPTEVPTETPVAEEPTDEPEEEKEEAGEAPPPPENALVIDSVYGYRDGMGSLHIVGLVTNYTDRAVDNIEIEIEIFDEGENSLSVETISASLYTLAPDETSPFSFWVYEDLPTADNYIATIVGQSAAEVERAEVSLEGVLLTIDDSGDLHITGSLVNNTENPIKIDDLAGATFDADGNLFTADAHSVVVRQLDPGEDGPFRVTMTGPAEGTSDIEAYEVYIDAKVTDPSATFDLVFSESHHNYLDAFGSFHLVGEITNNHNEFLTVSMVAGIYDADGNAIDAATTDTPTFSIAPGDTLPYDFQYWGPLNYKSAAIDAASSYTVQWDPYWTWDSTSEYIDLATQNDANEVGDFQATFTGEVLNTSSSEVESATVIVNLYDAQTGELTATGFGGIYETLAPGEALEYTVWIYIPEDFDINTVEYEIFAKGDLP